MIDSDLISFIASTRFIASFTSTGLSPRTNRQIFDAWLKHLELDNDDIAQIVTIAENGFEDLEKDAAVFVESMKDVL